MFLLRTFSLVLLIVLGFPTGLLQAQSPNRTGLRAGPLFSTFWGDFDKEDLTLEQRQGYTAGIEMSFALSRAFALQLEASYAQKGAIITSIEGRSRYELTYRLDYIELPILATLTAPSEGILHGRFCIGPFLAGLIHEEVSGTVQGITIPEPLLDDFQPDNGFTPFDGGLVIGAGLLFFISETTALSLDARFTLSGIPLDLDDSDFAANRAFGFTLGLSL